MAINFPNTPVLNDTFTVSGRNYTFDGQSWVLDSFIGYTGSRGPVGFTGSQGVGFTGSKGNDGTSVVILGTLPDEGSLPNVNNNNGDGYIINGDLWVWDGTDWNNVGPIQGPQGERGFTGSRGDAGFVGSAGGRGFTGSQGAGFTGSTGFTGSVGSFPDVAYTTGSVQITSGTGSKSLFGIGTDTGFGGSANNFAVGSYVKVTLTSNTNTYLTGTITSINTTFINILVDFSTLGSNIQSSWNVTYQGFKGDRGYTGSRGDAGFTGSQGTQGLRGFAGSQGVGFTGSQGAQGPRGFTGSTGTQGPRGFTGSQGAGFTGSTGFTGSAGGATTLNELTDVNITSPSNDQVLTYSGGNWINSAASGGTTVTIANDTATNETRYLTFVDATTGTVTQLDVSDTKLYYNPSTGQLNATEFNSLSDAAYKEDIVEIENSLEILKQITPYNFKWKDDGRSSYGIIAQDLEKILPELVCENSQGVKSVSYIPLIAILIDAVKRLSER